MLAPTLREAGYEVGYLGKWHLASFGPTDGPDSYWRRPVPPERRGGYEDFWLAADTLEFTSHGYDGYMFDSDGRRREFPPGRYRADVQTDWAIEYLRSRKGDRPFFLFNSYIEPHHQNDHGHYEGPHGSKERFKDFVVPGDLEGTDGDWREEYPDYLGCVSSLDANLGRIRCTLEELGIADQTVILYTSDHGSHFRTRNAEYKRSCHEGCIRIPLIAHGPGFTGSKVVDELVSLIDVPPTILRTAGAALPDFLRGRPLQQLLDGTADDWPQDIFLQISESCIGRAIRTRKWKYAIQAPSEDPQSGVTRPGSDTYVESFLYDLETDPHERTNLVSAPALVDVRAELAGRLKRRMRQAGEVEPTILPARTS